MNTIKPVYFDYTASLETGFGWRRIADAGGYEGAAQYGRQIYRDFLADQKATHATCAFWAYDGYLGLIICHLPTPFVDHIRRAVKADLLFIFLPIQRAGVLRFFQSLIAQPEALHEGVVDWMHDLLRNPTEQSMPTFIVPKPEKIQVDFPLSQGNWLVQSEEVGVFNRWLTDFGDTIHLAISTEVINQTRLPSLVEHYQTDQQWMGILATYCKVFAQRRTVRLGRRSGFSWTGLFR